VYINQVKAPFAHWRLQNSYGRMFEYYIS